MSGIPRTPFDFVQAYRLLREKGLSLWEINALSFHQFIAELCNFTESATSVTREEGAGVLFERICEKYGKTLDGLNAMPDGELAKLIVAEHATPNIPMVRTMLHAKMIQEEQNG